MSKKSAKKAFSKLLALLTSAIIILFTIPVISACSSSETNRVQSAEIQSISSEAETDSTDFRSKLGFALGVTVTVADMAVAAYLVRKAVSALK